MNKKENVIVIPIYKYNPSWSEIISFNQCIKVLFKHPICIVSYKELDIKYYTNQLDLAKVNYKVEFFDYVFFMNIEGYNRLLLSLEFYKRFAQYEFMLIYQLDAYVFNDELEYWCNQEYDYIGAPWFEDFGSYEEGKVLWKVGNGGFSLRKIKKLIRILSFFGPVYKPCQIRTQLSFRKSTNLFKTSFLFFFKCMGYKNNVAYLLKKNILNEDYFIISTFLESWITINVAPLEMAIKFSFEKSPQYLFELNNTEFAFGCHAWEKYQYDGFWSKYIKD